jgi:hypothetical protein
MYTARKVDLSILVLGSALFLAACGSSSSSGTAAFAGTYTVDGTASASDGASATRALESVVVVDDSGNVTVDPDTANAFTGTISGNDISAVVAGSRLNSPGSGISCTGAVRVTAAAFNTRIRDGAISSTSLVCNGVALDLGGEFSGPRVTSTGFPGGRDAPPLLGALRGAVQAAL